MKLLPMKLCVLVLLFAAPALASPTITFEAFAGEDNVRLETRVYVYAQGQREKHLFMRLVGVPVQMPVGVYDFEARFKTSAREHRSWLKNVKVTEDRSIRFDFDIALGRVRLDFTNYGVNVNHHTRWKVFPEGKRDKHIARSLGGGELLLEAGRYDVRAHYKDGNASREKWLSGITVAGEVRENVEFATDTASLTIKVRENGKPLKTASCKILRADSEEKIGKRTRYALAVATLSDQKVVLKPGVYHVLCSYGETGASSRAFVKDVHVKEVEELEVNLSVDRQALNYVELGSNTFPGGEGGVELIAPENEELPRGAEQPAKDLKSKVDPLAEESPAKLTLFEVDPDDANHVRMKIRLKIKGGSQAQEQRLREENDFAKGKNIQIILDASGSMWGRIAGEAKISIAKRVLRELFPEFDEDDVNVALRVYGTEPKQNKDCEDSKLLIPFSRFDSARFDQTLRALKPSGYTPLAYALEQATADFDPKALNSIILITDGIESCGGDPCKVAATLAEQGILSRSFVVGFDVDTKSAEFLSCLGQYYSASDGKALQIALKDALTRVKAPEKGSVAVFAVGDRTKVLKHATLDEDFQIKKGRYDIVVKYGDQLLEWKDVNVSSDVEKVAEF